MQENQRTINRCYILLDNSKNMCIMEKWSSTRLEWVMEKIVWNEYYFTNLKSALNPCKYYLGVF